MRVACGATGTKTFSFRYTSPANNTLSQLKIGSITQITRAMARMRLQELKQIRNAGRCPVTELKEEKKNRLEESQKNKTAANSI
ncbi:Arm DNA-binding domain-containing protein [Serratia fonticola]|uniref:Arm DNA-binding domain-containing protein n=1 Tax=Serratia fonticola TaxID=47917 RepID=UPI0021BDDFFE|nr:Arm DNA-binding domain-containing protein [Serratia fonticola]